MFTATIAVSLFVGADPPKEKELPEAAKKELKQLEGKWRVVKGANSTGEMDLDPKESEFFMVFKGGDVTFEFREKKETIRITAIDPSTDPKCIDLLEKREGRPDRTLEGVFKIDGDKLLLALSFPKDVKQRPVSFDKPTDARTLVYTLKRVKE